jgi:hypothetical protein
MRQKRTQRMATPATVPVPMPTPIHKPSTKHPTSGYVLIVDGQAKSEFDTRDRALKAARDLKGCFPRLQIKVYDAEKKLSETIEPVAA